MHSKYNDRSTSALNYLRWGRFNYHNYNGDRALISTIVLYPLLVTQENDGAILSTEPLLEVTVSVERDINPSDFNCKINLKSVPLYNVLGPITHNISDILDYCRAFNTARYK